MRIRLLEPKFSPAAMVREALDLIKEAVSSVKIRSLAIDTSPVPAKLAGLLMVV